MSAFLATIARAGDGARRLVGDRAFDGAGRVLGEGARDAEDADGDAADEDRMGRRIIGTVEPRFEIARTN